MKKSYENQILDHNIEKFNLIIKDDVDMFSSIEALIEASKNAELQVNFISNIKKIIKDLKWHVQKNEHIRL